MQNEVAPEAARLSDATIEERAAAENAVVRKKGQKLDPIAKSPVI
jgi:hypothetical protein